MEDPRQCRKVISETGGMVVNSGSSWNLGISIGASSSF